MQAGRDFSTRALASETAPELIGVPAPAPAPTPEPAPAPVLAPSQEPAPSVAAADGPSGITLAQVAENNTPESCWLAIAGKVYDLTSFAPSHPGEALLACTHILT